MSHPNGKDFLINFVKAPSLIGELGLIGVDTARELVVFE